MSSNLKIKRICAWCGKEFIAQKTTTACCSKQCANALYKKRKRDEAIKTNNQIVRKKIEEKPIERIKDKPFLTITEAALYLGVTRPTVYSYIRRDELKVIRLGFKYLLKKEDIDKLFNTPTEFHTPTKEKAPITDFYTTVEVKEKYHINESWIFAIAQKHGIPRTFNRGKTYWSKKHIDAYFAKKAPDPDITEWYSTQEMQEKFGMTLSAIYTFAHKNTIPKKKEGIMVYYSKKHVDIAKGIAKPEETMYYTVAEAMEKFNLTRDQLYHYVKWHHELDKLLAPPKIE